MFRESATGSEVILTPQSCISFAAGRDTFISYHGSRIMNTDNVLDVSGYNSAEMRKDSIRVFLRQAYHNGDYILYKLTDATRINFYFSDHSTVRELEYYEYVKENKDNDRNDNAVSFDGYKQYLFVLLANKNIRNLSARLNAVPYKEIDLVNFLASVLHDKGQSTVARRNRYPAEIFIGAGINANMGALLDFSDKIAFKQTSYAPSLEVGLRLYAQRNFGKIFFQPSVSGMPLTSKFYNDYYKLNATLVGANLGIGYLFVKQKNLSVFAVANGTLYLPFGLKTSFNKGNVHNEVKASDLNSRLTVRPELGVVIGQNISLLVSGSFPIKVPFEESGTYRSYKLTQLSFGVRYGFIQNKK